MKIKKPFLLKRKEKIKEMESLSRPLLVFAVVTSLMSAAVLVGCASDEESGPPFAAINKSAASAISKQPSGSAQLDLQAEFTLRGQRSASSDLAPLIEREISLSLRGAISAKTSLLELRAELGESSGRALFYSGSVGAVRLSGRWYRQRKPFFSSPLRNSSLVTQEGWKEMFFSLAGSSVQYSGQEESPAGKIWIYSLLPGKTYNLGRSRVARIAKEMIAAGARVELGYLQPTGLPVMVRLDGNVNARGIAFLLGLESAKKVASLGVEGQVGMYLYDWGRPLPDRPGNIYPLAQGERLLGWEFLPIWTEGSK